MLPRELCNRDQTQTSLIREARNKREEFMEERLIKDQITVKVKDENTNKMRQKGELKRQKEGNTDWLRDQWMNFVVCA